MPDFDLDNLPTVDAGEMMTLVLALLGLGATRTYEKLKGVSRESWTVKAQKPTVSSKVKDKDSTPTDEQKTDDKDFTKEEIKKAFQREPNDLLANYDL